MSFKSMLIIEEMLLWISLGNNMIGTNVRGGPGKHFLEVIQHFV